TGGSGHRRAAAAGADLGGSGDDGAQYTDAQARSCHADAEGRAQRDGGAGGFRAGHPEGGSEAAGSHEVSRAGGATPDARGDWRGWKKEWIAAKNGRGGGNGSSRCGSTRYDVR